MSKLISALTRRQQEMLDRILKLSTDSSAVALSEMTDRSIFLQSPKVDIVSLESIINIIGGAETSAISICLIFSGEVNGSILLIFPGESASALVGLVMQEDMSGREELDEMSISVLGEVGNLVSAYFLSTLSDHVGLDLRPSSPMVVQDMIGATISSAILMLERAPEEILYVETQIIVEESKTDGHILFFTDEDSLQTLLKTVEAR